MTSTHQPNSPNRTCSGCTSCCGGTLTGKAKGHYFYPGKPCHFVVESQGCTIYGDRPNQCRMFECVWLVDTTVPEALKPSESNLIILPGPMATPVHDKEVSEKHLAMYNEWARTRTPQAHQLSPDSPTLSP